MSKRLFNRFLDRTVKRGRLTVTYADGSTASFGTPEEGFLEVAIRFTDKRVPRDVIMDPRLGAGEAYMDGRIVVENGGIMELIELLRSNQPWDKGQKLAPPNFVRKVSDRARFFVRSVNKPGSARRNISHHYDVGNDLYQLMLDEEHMQYSCAYWPHDDMTLAEAQEAKLAHIAAKLALSPGQRVLDIGCGWGGMAIFLAQRAGVEVLGITLSQEQLALARDRAEAAGVGDRVRFELIDYRDLAARGDTFDRIVSVGMFEHVGTPQFETFFRCCANLMTEDGVMLMHTIGRMGTPGTTDGFTDKYIFPGGYIPALSETVEASEKVRLIASDIETLRLHYGKTLRQWYARCLANRETIVASYGERFFRMWTFYLAGATSSFENGKMCNYQIQYIRSRNALPLTRGYIEDAERALLGR
ncbi:methyltransferase domain-containing protein [Altererythrobacter salegens]|uniref:Methyltransferase domain-containing protein n=1 Tax=Croceibacterium salegens TaxID=1737568 RepID=A0A6I4STB1_9SPHN|nr:cyclopropane-fatty-acyl-phospholipid synthase family protein [Croceibacterium salegens]MXO59224.1 methyltransferase domain-containing protein [Croceibacterium salegens]